MRLKGGHCERETEVDVTFHFSCFACCFKQTLTKTNRSFHSIAVMQSFVARCCKMQCVRDAKQSERSLCLSRM